MRTLLANPKVQQLLRFIVVGAMGTGLYVGIALGLLELRASLLVSHGVAYVVSILFSYFAQKLVTFRVQGDHRRTGARFVIAVALISLAQYVLVFVMERLGVPDPIVVLLSAAFYPTASFFVHSLWTFRAKEAADPS